MAEPSAPSRWGTARMRRIVVVLFAADALALACDGWAGQPHWLHDGLAWPLTIAFATAGLLHGVAVVRASRPEPDPTD
jgi:hypothetical protein